MQRLGLIRDCAGNAFFLHLGDPTAAGLALSGLYLLAAGLSLFLVLRPRYWGPGERVLWIVSALAVSVLAINKQLDLHQSLILTGRCLARAEGWFDQRLSFQRNLGLVALAFLGLASGLLLWSTRSAFGRNKALLFGLLLLGLFVFLQISRFEKLAGPFAQMIVDFRLHRVLEAAGLVMVIWAAWRRFRRGGA